ncbi:hypothetical protein [Ammoniphilus resinae]|uniref:Prefoldin subunit 5 n=1 Tax=Ammoniphilus resinae TaxID=861532 RepID=A0ABS4GXK2_9BACL|nr:hypothetical protein [Ammoniphilus resinae]MBP1934996.1 prefoldin subunit 5 [Ammoniphilus resinae]
MPLPFILAGVAVAAVTGVAGAAAKAVNRDYEEELESINNKIKNLAEKTDRNYQNAQKKTEEQVNEWVAFKRDLTQYSLQRFVDSFGKLKKVDFKESKDLSLDQIKDIERFTLDYKLNSSGKSLGTESEAAVKGAVLGVVGGGAYFIGSLIKGVKLQYAIEEAEANLAELKVQAEKVKKAQLKLVKLGKHAQEMHQVAHTLNELFILALQEMEGNMNRYGTDYSKYGQEVRKQVYVTAEFAKTIKHLIDAPLVSDRGGELHPKSGQALKTAQAYLEQAR